MKTISIAIADDETLFRKGMSLLLNGHDNLQVDLEAENGVDLLEKLAAVETLPDVLLLDLKMPKMNGIEAAKFIQKKYSGLKIIVISTHFSRAFIINMIELSAVAYLPKNSQPEEVVETIEAVYEKGFHYNAEVMAIIRENIISKKKPKAQFSAELTNREKEVLQLICEQYTAPEIAEKLFISARTVDGHRNNLLSKLECKNVAGLVVYVLQNQLIEIPLLKLRK
jgi:DNA-binding NarL/FixJ family response regulator